MHVIDSLAAGGTERVAVNLANHLPRDKYEVHLCATRTGGALADLVAADVGMLILGRRSRFDLDAVRRLSAYIRQHDIRLLHAHGSSVFTALAATVLRPNVKVVWHIHAGRLAEQRHKLSPYWLLAHRVQSTIVVSEPLAHWSQHTLGIPADQLWYIPNFALAENVGEHSKESQTVVLGQPGTRIVCVANLRPQKDHLTLINALAKVREQVPDVHLLLVGATSVKSYVERVEQEIVQHDLARNITLMGEQSDVFAILEKCDIGVLSSISEGLPLALIEYGMAGLASVATEVGQCREVLDSGRTGILVPPSSPDALADALLRLLMSAELRKQYGGRFRSHVQTRYSAGRVISQVCCVYDTVLTGNRP